MTRIRQRGRSMRSLGVAVGLAALVLCNGSAKSQAWVDAPGTISASLHHEIYWGGDYLWNTDALDGTNVRGEPFDGRRIYLGEIRSHTQQARVDYAIRSRLALSLDLAMVTSRYRGFVPWNLEIDDGEYHADLQDLQLQIRYQTDTRWLTVTPVLGFSVPLSDYESSGHATIGGGLDQLLVGVFLGRLGVPIRSTYVHASVFHRWLEEIVGQNIRMTNLSLEAGWWPHRRLVLSTSVARQFSRGGLEWYDEDDDSIHGGSTELPVNASNARFTRLALGADYRIFESVSVGAAYTTTVWGENLTDADYLSVGLSYRFRAPWARSSMWE